MPQNMTLDKEIVEDSSRIRMAEIGSTGLPTVSGLIRDDKYAELEFPAAAHTYKSMSYHPTISSAITVIQDTIRQVEWVVEGEDQERVDFIESCMKDMDRSFGEYINEFLSMIIYGFSINEKVFKRRKKGKSKFTDGLIGWKKLPSRNQATIKRWVWDEKGNDLIGCIQDLNLVKNGNLRYPESGNIVGIPKEKFLHFRLNAQLDNPEGNSPLKGAYIPWQYLATLEEYQAIGVSRDLGGMPVVYLPPEYMSDNASDDKKAVYAYMQQVVRNITANEQAGLILPKFVDPDTKADMFDFELVGVSGGKSYDTNAIIERYQNVVLMSFLSDVLILGHGGNGSFALASEKSSLLELKIKAVLDQMIEVINSDLIPHTYRINGWDDTETVKITYKSFDRDSIDELGKFVQRAVSVGAMEVDKELSNALRDRIEVPPADPDNPIEIVNEGNSGRGGDGMKTAGEGTAETVDGGDASATNLDNAS